MEYYVLTWTEEGRSGRIDLNTSEATATLLASALLGDPAYTDVTLLRQQLTSNDLTVALKNGK